VFSDVGNVPSSLLNHVEFGFVSMQVTVLDVILCIKILPTLGPFSYGCPMVNMSITFVSSVHT
jgi:hypothetical protein